MLAAACLELEGVLLEARAARRAALQRSLAVDGVALADDEFERWCDGLPTAAAVDRAVQQRAAAGDAAASAMDATARELAALRAERGFEAQVAAGVTLVPGAREAAEALAVRLRLAVVTRAGRAVTDRVLAAAGLEGLFAAVVTADDVRAPKPDPAGHQLALARLARRAGALEPRTVAALEDAAPGVIAARAAGLRAVLVTPGPSAAPSAHAVPGTASAAPADARLSSVAGLTPLGLAAALDLVPASHGRPG
jgi:HAD superfamily hydrolase (TIGR01509 family)